MGKVTSPADVGRGRGPLLLLLVLKTLSPGVHLSHGGRVHTFSVNSAWNEASRGRAGGGRGGISVLLEGTDQRRGDVLRPQPGDELGQQGRACRLRLRRPPSGPRGDLAGVRGRRYGLLGGREEQSGRGTGRRAVGQAGRRRV